MTEVFLSYSHEDAQIVGQIANDLSNQGVKVWFDRKDLKAGEKWAPQIASAIKQADFMLVFLSRKSVKSKWVKQEYRLAIERMREKGGNRIIPVLLEKLEVPEILSDIQYADFTKSYFEGMQYLFDGMSKLEGPKPEDVLEVNNLAKEVALEVSKLLGLEPVPQLGKKDMAIDPKLVFVIISFRDDMEPIYEGIKTAASTVGLEAKRVKDVPGDYRITDQIIQMIHSASLIVADLTYERPNVYFELGYARGLGKTVVTTARLGTNIHFDVKDWTFISYTDSRILERNLIKRFEYELSLIN